MIETRPTIPGLELPELPDGSGAIATSARATLDALESLDLLEPRHALTCQLVMSLAITVDRGFAAHRVSVATATLSKQLLEAIATLPEPVVVPQGFTDFVAQLEELANS